MFPKLGIKPDGSKYNVTGSIGDFAFEITGNPGLKFRVIDNVITDFIWVYPAIMGSKEVKIWIR